MQQKTLRGYMIHFIPETYSEISESIAAREEIQFFAAQEITPLADIPAPNDWEEFPPCYLSPSDLREIMYVDSD
jgi:hypothetical protein